jgi:sigma-B regulation protein RsbU (phosphoserine phosphatase)
MSDKLRFVDVLFRGRAYVREMGRHLMWATGWSLLLLAIPAVLLLLGSGIRNLGFSLLPLNLILTNMRVPGGLIGNAILGPLFAAVVLGAVFLGVVYPILRLRFSVPVAGAVFGLLYALGVGWLLEEAMIGPVGVAFVISLIVGWMLFAVMEKSGLLASLTFLYVPLAFVNVALLLRGAHSPFFVQGWLSLGILLALLALAGFVALNGRPLAQEESYEPAYLVRMRERERFARELEIAKGVQERFLPKVTPVIEGFSLATRCVPAMEVGGDYFDFLSLPDGKWLLLLGDVSGKGVKAAFYMTLTKGILHAIAGSENDHTQILLRLNRIFGSLSEPGIFLTLCAVVLEPETRRVQLLSAGHNPPFLIRKRTASVLQPKGLVLGVMGDEVFLKSLKDVHMTLEPGDTLVLYTDGVTEAMDRDHQEFGMERLQATLDKAAGKGSQGILESVVEGVLRFQQGCAQADDMTLLILQAHET